MLDGKRDVRSTAVREVHVPAGSYAGRGAWIGALVLATVFATAAAVHDPKDTKADFELPRAIAVPLSALIAAPVGAFWGALVGWSIRKETIYELGPASGR